MLARQLSSQRSVAFNTRSLPCPGAGLASPQPHRSERARFAASLAPGLPLLAARHIAKRTVTMAAASTEVKEKEAAPKLSDEEVAAQFAANPLLAVSGGALRGAQDMLDA